MRRVDLFISEYVLQSHQVPVTEYVKNSVGASDVLKREATILRHVAHPDVVAVSSFSADVDGTKLRLVAVNGIMLSNIDRPLNGSEARPLFTVLAGVVAHLHQRGVAHTRINDNHVIVRHNGRPTICGFSQAKVMPRDDEALAIADVVCLGKLMLSLLPSPLERLRNRIDTSSNEDLTADRDLTTLARSAANGKLTAAQLHHALNTRKVTTRPNVSVKAPRNYRPALAAVALLVAGSVFALSQSMPPTSSAAKDNASELIVESPEAPQKSGILIVGEDSYALGVDDDGVIVGRWNCEDELPALLRKADGTVWTFSAWPSAGKEIRGRQVTGISGAVGIDVEANGDCHRLIVRDRDGVSSTLDLKEF